MPHWFNNGTIQVFRELPPDDTFIPGMLQSSKEKMSRPFSEEHKQKLSIAAKNRSEEAQQRINLSLKGRSAWNKGGTSWCKGLTNLTDSRVATRSQKISQSLIGRVGTNLGKHFTDEHKKNISNALKGQKRGKLSAERHKTFVQKCDSTRRRNHTFNTSKAESQMCEALKIQYSGCTVLTQYKDTRYPFNCDFYVVEKDLFIELNAHWTRGGQPYDPDNPECQKQLLEWQEKAKTSKYYQNAIYVWTDLDVRKRKIAEENKLNYQVLY